MVLDLVVPWTQVGLLWYMHQVAQSAPGNSYVDLGSDIICEAKCHYLGWQARYDEWVVFPSDRVAVHYLHTVTKREKLLREKKK